MKRSWPYDGAYPPPKKRFDIEHLLYGSNQTSNRQNENENLVGSGLPLDDYVEKLDESSRSNNRFKLTRHTGTYVIKNIDKAPDPERILHDLFEKCISETIHGSSFDVDILGCCISSEMLDSDIQIPLRSITENTSDAILNRFIYVSQSARESSVLGAPFTLRITAVSKRSLPRRQRTEGGNFQVKHQIERPYLFEIQNTNNSYCLFYSCEITRIYALKKLPNPKKTYNDFNFYNFKMNLGEQHRNILRVLSESKIKKNLPLYDVETYLPILQQYYDKKYGNGLIKIFVFNDYGLYRPIFTSTNSKDFTYPICIYHTKGHFDGIRTISRFFKKRYYCLYCEKPYNNNSDHAMSCVARCMLCSGVGAKFPCPPTIYKKQCSRCSKTFLNQECYIRHIKNRFCLHSKQCLDCGIIYNLKKNQAGERQGHVCGETFCLQCLRYHDPDNGCFIRKFKLKEAKPYRVIVYDFETDQSQLSKENPNCKEHKVNFITANIVCTECIEDEVWSKPLKQKCEICGKHRTRTWSHFKFSKTKVDKAVITDDPLGSFTKWLLYGLDPEFKSICFAHFGGRFDMTFIFGELYHKGVIPEMIRQGNRLFEMKVKRTSQNPELLFHDSYNLMPIALSKLVKAFDLKIKPKLYFPYLYNRRENYNTTIPTLPPKEDYLHNSKKPEDRDDFERWYDANYQQEFCLNEKLAEYCVSDVQILLHALVSLRESFFELTSPDEIQQGTSGGEHEGIDIFWNAMTIASACMKDYRLNHMKENHIAIVPEKGYDHMQNQSFLALKFLQWYQEKYKVEIQTALSEEGEKKVGNYSLDGYIRKSGGHRNLAIEVNGCYYHGCTKCFPNNQTALAQGKSAGFIRQKDAKRLCFLRRLMDVEMVYWEMVVYWECEIKEMLNKDPDMKNKFDNYIDCGPINLKDAYFGGRTGPAKLYHKVDPGYKISYKDFTSLYPYTNYVTPYPVGHPKLKVFSGKKQDVNWTQPEDNIWKGILKVLVVPPKHVDVAVLPTRFDERLLFPLCRKCSIEHPEGARIKNYACTHSDDERSFISTCTHIELNEALAQGYRVRKIFRVLRYENFDAELFKSYVSRYMALKIEASGFPEGVKDEDKFIEECYEKFNIKIHRSRMQSNPAIRYIAKLMLNSLWGRFSLRNQLSKSVLVNDPAKLRGLLDDTKLDVSMLDELTEDLLLVTYSEKTEFIREHDCSNVVLSLWTTSAARILLLKSLQKVAETPNCQILYHDTDSVIYVHPIENDPLLTGEHLGELTEEYSDHEIVEYASAGCKNYALKMVNKKNPFDIKYVIKVRGITLDYNTCKKLHYETFLQKVFAYVNKTEEDVPILLNYPNFIRPSIKQGAVYTTQMSKFYRPIVTKGIVGEDFVVRNYGYNKN